jgi:group I intron endonuclease
MPLIYKITCKTTGKIYIGQTRLSLKDRWHGHKSAASSYAKLADKRDDQNGMVITRAIARYGHEQFTIEVVEECSYEQLDEREKYHIAQHNSQVPNGYNVTKGGSGGDYSERGRQRRREIVHKTMDRVCVKFRVHKDDLEGLPKHCIRLTAVGAEGYAINKHPKCKRKNFSISKYGSLEAAKEALMEYYKSLETETVAYVSDRNKKDTSLPAGLRKVRNGYMVDKTIKGKKYRKFYSAEGSDEANLAAAYKFYENALKENGLECSPTTRCQLGEAKNNA